MTSYTVGAFVSWQWIMVVMGPIAVALLIIAALYFYRAFRSSAAAVCIVGAVAQLPSIVPYGAVREKLHLTSMWLTVTPMMGHYVLSIALAWLAIELHHNKSRKTDDSPGEA